MPRQINADGLKLIRSFEGCVLHAYQDTGGVWTIGYGHTGPEVRAGLTCTQAEAESWLISDLGTAERAVETLVKVPLSDNNFAALVSLCFNIGAGAFGKSTLLRLLNAGHYEAVPGQINLWNRVAGRPSAGLTRRRAAEAALWSQK